VARIVIGTRGSALALWQARHVAALLRERHPGLEVTEEIVRTDGDADEDSDVSQFEATGVFVRALERALLAGAIDLAVHSLKDLPTDQPTGLMVVAVPPRHDARDALVSLGGWELHEVPPGTVVGTSSPRRRAQLLHARPDLQVQPLRGNVDTRVQRLRDGRYGALLLAVAGLERLGIRDVGVQPLRPELCLPAVGQGALAVEARVDDRATLEIAAVLHHEPTAVAVTAERAFFRRLGGGCLAPAAAYARFVHKMLTVEALVGEPDGHALLMECETGAAADAAVIGARLAERLLVAGGRQMLERARLGLRGAGANG
jgi:hydroxymethylbilane synthase